MVERAWARQRDRLVGLLQQAARLEHSVCCQYLFAAFSMRTAPQAGICDWSQVELLRRWRGTTLSIARMEMEHLAIVCNLLGAVGEAPEFRREDFPTASASPIGQPGSLDAFSLTTLGRFILYEFPDTDMVALKDFVAFLKTSSLPADRALLAQLADAASLEQHSLAAMYDEVTALLTALASPGSPPLFVGPPSAQVGNAAVFPGFPPVPDNARNYDVLITKVIDMASALAAVQQVRDEGEGATSPVMPDGGHFERFVAMYVELSQATQQDGGFEPARPVVSNPRSASTAAPLPDPQWTVVTNAASAEAMEIYDLAYDLTLRLLTRFFAAADADEMATLQDVVFFPMMTLVLRPLGDVVASMPAFDPDDGRYAGPSFTGAADVDLQPSAPAAFAVLCGQLDEIRDRTAALAASTTVPLALRPRFEFLAENTWRIAANFAEKASFGIPT